MSKPSRVIILLEDARQEQLARRYLKKRGLRAHDIRFERSPTGRGSAEGWVRERYSTAVSAYRNRQAKALTALIVLIDADTETVKRRMKQLDQALKDSGKQPVDPNLEDIARLVPKRNVETWILCLNEQTVDEKTDYKGTKENWGELIPQAAETLSQWRSGSEMFERCIDSLRTGVSELKRLKF